MGKTKQFKELTEDQLEAVTGGKTYHITKDKYGCYVDDNGVKHCPVQ